MGKFLSNGILLVVLSLAAIFLMDAGFYQNWFGYLAISTIPALVIINAVWQFRYPGVLAHIVAQPWRGLAFTVFAVIIGLPIAYLSMRSVGRGISPPTPFLMMFIILSVVMVMWQLILFEGWPFNRLGAAAQGWAMLATSYGLAYLIYRLCFDFSQLTGIPQDWLALAPQGWFEPWAAIVYAITTLGVIFAWQLLEFKPLSSFKSKQGVMARQPIYGMLLGGIVLLIAFALFRVGTVFFSIDAVSFMVRGPVAFLFGIFLILDTTANQAFAGIRQPFRGALLIVLSMLLGSALCIGYELFMFRLLPQIGSGPPGYAAELWLANAMLSMTFPLILIYCHFFSYWPLQRNHSSPATTGGERVES